MHFSFLVILFAGVPAILAMPIRGEEDLATRTLPALRTLCEYRNDERVMGRSDSFLQVKPKSTQSSEAPPLEKVVPGTDKTSTSWLAYYGAATPMSTVGKRVPLPLTSKAAAKLTDQGSATTGTQQDPPGSNGSDSGRMK